MEQKEIIGYDFQGWPICKMTVRDILRNLGLTKISNRSIDYWQIADDDPILDICPQTLEDDGMGYGVNPHFVIEVNRPTKDDIYIFIDKEQKEKNDDN